MKLITFLYSGQEHAGVVVEGGVAPVLEINSRQRERIPNNLLAIVRAGITEIRTEGVAPLPFDQIQPRLPFIPPKIWCIGLNYRSHADDIEAVQPEEPGSFLKPASCMIHPGGFVDLPPADLAAEIDGEGELGVVIGKTCRYLPPEQVSEAIYGYTTTLDFTALDILRKNPRYLTRAKSFDTFFSFGPVVVTADEAPDVDGLEIVTEHNGGAFSRDFVRNMKMRPHELVRFHSDYMMWEAGDLISTGCPKGVRLQAGDRVGAWIEGIGRLEASVRQGFRSPMLHGSEVVN